MAKQNDLIRTIVVSVHLGSAPEFDIRADEDATSTPVGCAFDGHGTGPADRDFLNEVLAKIVAAYGTSPAITLCLQNRRIQRDINCV